MKMNLADELILAEIKCTYCDTAEDILEANKLGKDATWVLKQIIKAGKGEEFINFIKELNAADADAGQSHQDLYHYTWEDLDELLHHDADMIGVRLGISNL